MSDSSIPSKPPPPADTDLLRLVWINFKNKQDDLEDAGLTVDDVNVHAQVIPHDTENRRYLAVASTPLQFFPAITPERKVRVPERERKELENALEIFANLLAISRRTATSISSLGSGSVFLCPRSDRAKDWLAHADGFAHPPISAGGLDVWCGEPRPTPVCSEGRRRGELGGLDILG
jgi:hypothetical protein